MRKEYFRILAPLTTLEDVEILKEAGADELYCGYVTEELTKKWPLAFNILNRRGEGQSFEDYEIFKETAEKARKYNLPVYVTFNGLYTHKQYPLLLECIRQIERLPGVKGIIVADVCLLLALRKNNFKKEIHISAGGTGFNSSAINFYAGLGAQRIIFPRETTVHEIREAVIKSTKIDTEIFILSEPCGGFIDGLCSFFHCYEKYYNLDNDTLVSLSYNTEQEKCGCSFYSKQMQQGNFEIFDARTQKQIENRVLRSIAARPAHLSFGCNLCGLYDLKDLPIIGLKIVGRGTNLPYVSELVKTLKKTLVYLLKRNITRKNYIQKCKELFSGISINNGRRCTKFDCYFSPHWVRYEK